MILLDTNVVSDGLKPAPNPNVQRWMDDNEAAVWISSITVAELYAGVEVMSDGRRKTELRAAVTRAIEEFAGACVPFDALAAQEFARIVGARKRSGRPIEPLDAEIAAIAITTGLSLATLNTKDFEGIEGLRVVNPEIRD